MQQSVKMQPAGNIKEKKGLELAAAKFIWRKMGWSTLEAAKTGIEISFDDLCKALADFARERG